MLHQPPDLLPHAAGRHVGRVAEKDLAPRGCPERRIAVLLQAIVCQWLIRQGPVQLSCTAALLSTAAAHQTQPADPRQRHAVPLTAHHAIDFLYGLPKRGGLAPCPQRCLHDVINAAACTRVPATNWQAPLHAGLCGLPDSLRQRQASSHSGIQGQQLQWPSMPHRCCHVWHSSCHGLSAYMCCTPCAAGPSWT